MWDRLEPCIVHASIKRTDTARILPSMAPRRCD